MLKPHVFSTCYQRQPELSNSVNSLKCVPVSRFLQTAEMLKPSTPSASHDSTGSSGAEDGAEYYPHIGESAEVL